MKAEQEMKNSNTSSIAQTRNSPKQPLKIFMLKATNDMGGIFKSSIKCAGHIEQHVKATTESEAATCSQRMSNDDFSWRTKPKEDVPHRLL